MTSFVAWIGVDSRGPTSLYFASDSRVTWLSKGAPSRVQDGVTKIFVARRCADMFGVVGFIAVPKRAIARAIQAIEALQTPSPCESCPVARAEWIASLVRHEIDQARRTEVGCFRIFYGTRIESGMSATFHVFQIQWNSQINNLFVTQYPIPPKSAVLTIDGTGLHGFEMSHAPWATSELGNTSRIVFSAFCDALDAAEDKSSGGEPQLAALYRSGQARMIGVVTARGSSIAGKLCESNIPLESEWRDSLFHRVSVDGALLKGAQRHNRPKGV